MWKTMLLLWLAGVCLRLTVLAVPPVIPLIHGSLDLTQAQVGALVSLPVLLFSIAAVPGSLLIARFGPARVLAGGIALTGLASALRGASFDAMSLFATTFLMGAGIAVMQPALPAVVREQLPQRVALGTAVFSNGLLVGEGLAATLTLPFVVPLMGGWRGSLVAWSVPVLAIALACWFYFVRGPVRAETRHAGWPDWRSPITWRLGFIAGGSSSLYFATNAFLPDYLHGLGRAELVAPSLAAINWVQIPASFLLLAFPDRLMMRRWPLVATGLLATVAVAGLCIAQGAWFVVWSGVVGFCTAFVLVLAIALPPMLFEPADVPRVSAAMFAISYLCAILTPVLGGVLWDATGIAWTAFLPAGVFAFAVAALSAGWKLRGTMRP
jgi:CP family cyanate transporter-like MFS transporter